jgi:hypothetical protein
MDNDTAAAKLSAIEARAKLAPAYPGPGAECVRKAQGIINDQAVYVYIIDGSKIRYENYATGIKTLTREEILAMVA